MRSKLSSRVLSVLLALVLVLSTLSTMAFAAGEKSDDFSAKRAYGLTARLWHLQAEKYFSPRTCRGEK